MHSGSTAAAPGVVVKTGRSKDLFEKCSSFTRPADLQAAGLYMYFEVFGEHEGCGPGEIRMGNQTLGPGCGFFAPADAPYGYVAGPEGVELLEFRARSAYDSQVHESPDGWVKILEAVRANRDAWAEELSAFR